MKKLDQINELEALQAEADALLGMNKVKAALHLPGFLARVFRLLRAIIEAQPE